MKQRELYRFSRSAAKKGSCSGLLVPIIKIISVYAVFSAIILISAYAVCRYFFFSEAVLALCAFKLILQITAALLTVKSRCDIIRQCIVKIPLSCGYERKICKKLRILALIKLAVRSVLRLLTHAVILSGIWLLLYGDAVIADDAYRLLSAFQAVPLLIIITALRIKLMFRFQGAEVLAVRYTEKSLIQDIRESGKMLMGQYGFITAVILRNTAGLIIPFLLPKLIQTFAIYFSVRHIEWQYSIKDSATYEQTHIQSKYKRAYEA